MILFHGTNQDIETIDITAGNKYKDFGQGFYLTPNFESAERMAQKKAHLFGGTPTIISYEYNESVVSPDLKMKVFPEMATAEWIQFIAANRDRSREFVNEYDIVKGPIADDGVVLQLTNLRNKILSPENAAILLQDKYLDQQYCFRTEASLSLLTKIDVCQRN